MFGISARLGVGIRSMPARPAAPPGASHLDAGVVELAHREDLLGYGYIEPEANGQMERWLLFRDTNDNFEITASWAEVIIRDLDDWKRFVREEASGGLYLYIKARSVVYTRASAGWETKIPDPLPPAPDPLARDGALDVGFLQTDSGGRLFQRDELQGHFRTFHDAPATPGARQHNSREYWLLHEDFEPAGEFFGPDTSIEADARRMSLPDYVREMQPYWVGDARFVITGCVNYEGYLPPDL